jgi:excisionase family DNA binding protein
MAAPLGSEAASSGVSFAPTRYSNVVQHATGSPLPGWSPRDVAGRQLPVHDPGQPWEPPAQARIAERRSLGSEGPGANKHGIDLTQARGPFFEDPQARLEVKSHARSEKPSLERNRGSGGMLHDDDWLLTPHLVAELLACSAKVVYAWAARGLLPSVRLGRLVRFRLSDVRDFVARHTDRAR